MTTATDDQSGAVATAEPHACGHARNGTLDGGMRELLRRSVRCLRNHQRDEPGRRGVTHFEIAHLDPGLDETVAFFMCTQAVSDGYMDEVDDGFFVVSETGQQAI